MRKMFRKSMIAGAVTMVLGQGVVFADDPIPSPVPEARVVVFKEQRRLKLFSGDRLVREYTIGLGFEPVEIRR